MPHSLQGKSTSTRAVQPLPPHADSAELPRDVLDLRPASGPKPRVRWLIVVGLALLGLAGYWLWRLIPSPPPDFSPEDLRGAYNGMVRNDGLNDLSVITPNQPRPAPLPVTPVACSPLFDTTISNQFPSGALDGVSTYWMGDSATIALFTVRYPDVATTSRQYEVIESALKSCDGQQVRFGGRFPLKRMVHSQATAGTGEASRQLAYRADPTSGVEEIRLFQLRNTISWQYRYDYSKAPYSPASASDLMGSLATQLVTAQEAMHSPGN